jgi:hypothetical protein
VFIFSCATSSASRRAAKAIHRPMQPNHSFKADGYAAA